MLRVEVPKDKKKLVQQIEALRYQISVEINETDRQIHMEALKALEKGLAKYEQLTLADVDGR